MIVTVGPPAGASSRDFVTSVGCCRSDTRSALDVADRVARTAHVLPDDYARERQRTMCRFNAIFVHFMSTGLLTLSIVLTDEPTS